MPEDSITLYVLFHGLWAFEARADGIHAHTPIEEEHEIVAGHFVTAHGGIDENFEALAPGRFELLGVTAGNKNAFNGGENPLVFSKDIAFPQRRFCIIELPLPSEIRSLRQAPTDGDDLPIHPFAGVHGEKLHPNKVSMVQLFKYMVADLNQVKLYPSGAKPILHPSGKTAALHVHASPPAILHNKFHVREAYSKLADLFKLDIIAAAALFEPALDPDIDGLTSDDMKSRVELKGMHSMFVGESGSNCDALIIDNRP